MHYIHFDSEAHCTSVAATDSAEVVAQQLFLSLSLRVECTVFDREVRYMPEMGKPH